VNTDQWLIFNFPPGAGGKFLIACFFQFRNIAHWAGKAMTPQDSLDWYCNSLPKENEEWPAKEIDTPWHIQGVSRAWPRGEQLESITIDNEYFDNCWRKGLIIPDFWHKTKRPAWWSNANWISIYIDDVELYKKLLFAKLFEFRDHTVFYYDQRPDTGNANNQAQKKQFQNQWQWNNVASTDAFYEQEIKKLYWHQAWDFEHVPNNHYIKLTELIDVDLLYRFLLQFETQFQQTVSREYIEELHNNWYRTTIEKSKRL